ncbi:DUF294 nucleotidyltransferase-like domain-containing protein [Zunongwangia sp. HGR-M22]|uniref:DUF294 nucleotidyltransferase-like domain-containing protein n=1 Tax=Zunongwangia sp. HGR-M22 TaxID=3015168 RepID=UPI0022DD5DA9|nr:DUF294 nucleotidyltransferase-like domain-containing protein [Zunongwangia sp. HGR-M22]WBL24497.1 DUF294 nucleotidyltransferase-like domain-containing protein [Zunongwangia sp. HGR-M22]
MKNSIAHRIADFLKDFPPFTFLNAEELLAISEESEVLYIDKGNIVFHEDEKGHSQFYIVHKGAIQLQKFKNNQYETLDTCDEGDIFGLRPLFAEENYIMNAIAEEESIVYGIPIDIFKPLSESNKKVGHFLIQSFATNTRNPYAREDKGKLFSGNDIVEPLNSGPLFELQPAPVIRKIVTTSPETKIRSAAQLMSKRKIGSVIVTTEDDLPVGILTDEDFRDTIATGQISIDTTVEKIMSYPVICYPKNVTIAQAQITMMKHNINHICITEDGTPNTRVIGILSEHDIMVSRGNSPSVLMKAIQRSRSTKELKKIRNKINLLLSGYIENNIPLTHISKLIFELNDATIKRVISRCVVKLLQEPPVKFAWLSMGSQGRKEQLLQTDQDNAIIFADPPNDKLEETRQYFLQLATKVNKRLMIVGYEYCPADMMAKTPRWCLSLSEWKAQVSKWIKEPGPDEILLSNIFFDYDITYGDVYLSNQLSDYILSLIEGNRKFLTVMGANALRNPSPLGFFRQFLVEQDGEKKDFFDIKKRGLQPLTEAARLLILSYKIKNISNTVERFERLAQIEPKNKELFEGCAYASKALLKFRTKQGLQNRDSGRFIDLSKLSKEDRMKLKRTFKSIKAVQELIKIRFETSVVLQ